ncbi:SRPBCC family protein [Mycobacterium sp. Marseille-P9652]|uniref:SRPBCC family protein n=1 Tax=Mycobacterium sp. Marseille-P9652 TaxID=2654950 RepID=UPI0012E9456A|nr:SRPBCC family protein [Mycobacterium sp. Marseille-P9652]
MVEIHLEWTIAAPVESVFDWLADPVNLAAAPLVLRARYTRDAPGPGAGAVRQVLGVGTWFREVITAYDRPRRYTYLIVGSFPPFDHEGGTLTFTAVDGGTHVDWLSNYTHPVWAGGRLLEAVSYRLLCSSFDAIVKACARALER